MNEEWNGRMRRALSEQEPADLKEQMERLTFLVNVQSGRNRGNKIGFWELLARQVPLIGWRIWGMEAAALFLISLVLRSLFRDPCFFTPRKIAFCLSCGTVAASMLLLPVFYRSMHFKMMEVESAAYFSFRRLMASRFLLFFGGEMAGMGVIGAIAYGRQVVNGSMLIYALAPMLLAGEGILFLLKRSSPDKWCTHYACYEGALLLFLCAGYGAAPQIFDGKYTGISMAVGVVLLGCFIWQCVELVKHPKETIYA